MQCLSPVPTEADTSELLEASVSADYSFQSSSSNIGNILSLRDSLHNHITVVCSLLYESFQVALQSELKH